MTIEELRRRAERARWDCESLDRDLDEAETEVWLARAAGDTELERTWQERARQLDDAAYRAWERVEEAEEAVSEAEYEAEYPQEAAAERAASEIRLKEVSDRLLRDGKITPEFYRRLTGSAPKPLSRPVTRTGHRTGFRYRASAS